MHRPASEKRSGSRTTGANTLITAASLALTLSGWAVLTANEAEPAPQAVVNMPSPTPVEQPALPVLPTVVPPPDWATLPLQVPDAATPAAAGSPQPRQVDPPPPARGAAVAPTSRPNPVAVTRSSR
jgi:hypothetical protein